jgi:hypothetical protein
VCPPVQGFGDKADEVHELTGGASEQKKARNFGLPAVFSIVERDKKDPRFKAIYRMEAVSFVGVPLHTPPPFLGIICYHLLEFDKFLKHGVDISQVCPSKIR